MHLYRTHTCGALTAANAGNTVRLSGWVHRIRDHGGLLFVDLRDHYGITQCVIDPDSTAFADAEKLRAEWVIRFDGEVKRRDAETINPKLPTGEIEVFIRAIEVLGPSPELPLPVFGEPDYPEDIRLTLPLPRSAPRDAARQHRQAHQGDFARCAAAWASGLRRVLDADPDRVVARGRARLPRAEPHSCRASSSRCRRRRSSTSSC